MPTPPISGQPHPDVEILKHVLREGKEAELVTYETLAKSVQMDPRDPKFRSRCYTAMRQLMSYELPVEDRIVFSCVPTKGYLRESGAQTIARLATRESRSLRRKARKNKKQALAVDATKLSHGERAELYGLVTINGVIEMATSKPARAKLTAACSAMERQLSMTKALEVLKERSGGNGKTG